MYFYYFFIAIIACALFSAWASSRVHSTFSAFSQERLSSNMTGYDTAVRLLRANGIYDVSVERTKGRLSDHFDPRKKVVRLSQSTFGDNSVAAVAVAAHEIGHVVQKEKGYLPYKLRTALVPIANFGSYLALVGVVLYGLSTLFTLVTLPVELNASKRAKRMLLEEGIVQEDELYGAEKVLSAAALTYLAALLTSLVYFLRFAWYVFMLFGRNRRD